MADADLTRHVDAPVEPFMPLRSDIKVLNVARVDEEEPAAAPAEETFADPLKRIVLDDEEHEELAQLIDDALEDIKAQRADLDCDGNWDLWEDSYFGVLGDAGPGQQNRVHRPITQEIIDTIGAVTQRALFTAQPVFQISPREAMDVETAKRKEQHLDYAFMVEMRGPERLEPILFEGRLLGTGVIHLPWLLETDRIRDEEVYDALVTKDMERFVARYPDAKTDMPDVVARLRKHQKVRIAVEYTEAIYDAPDLTYVPLRDWLVRPRAKAHLMHRELLVGHEFPLRWDDLVRLDEEGYYDDVDPIKFQTNEKNEQVEVPDYENESYVIVTGVIRWRRKDETRERRYLFDYHQKSRTITRLLRYPYWHNRVNYIPVYYQKSTRYIYGVSIAQKVEHSQAEANASHSLLLDLLSYSVPMFAARTGTESVFNPMRDGIYAGKTWYVPNPGQDIQQFQVSTPASANILVAIEGDATRHAELASGATQNLSGIESARDPTAPGTKTIHQTTQALVRIGQYLGTIAPSLTELAFQIEELYYQFSPEGRVYRIVGSEGVPAFPQISRADLRLRADYYPHISTAALNPDKEKADTMEAAATILKEPEVAKSLVKRAALWELALDAMGSDWSKKKHKILPSKEELELAAREEALALKVRRQKLEQAEAQLEGGVDVRTPGSNGAGQGGGGQGAAGAPSGGADVGPPAGNGRARLALAPPTPGPGAGAPFALR